MMLLFCSALLQILFVNGGFVDITSHNDNFTGIIAFTADAYIGFFSRISGIASPPVCKLSYIFGMSTINSTSTTCSDLNNTEYGDSFECGAVDSTLFECKRMGRNGECENNKSWTVFKINNTLIKKCAGICSVNISETISITYQENITIFPETACPRPTYSTTAISTALTILETSPPTPTSSATSHSTTQSTEPDSSNSTMNVIEATENNFTKFIPLIAGLSAGVGILLIFLIGMIIVCVKGRRTKSRNNIQRTSAVDPNVGNENGVYDNSQKTSRGASIYGRDLNKLSGIDLDVLDNVKAAKNDSTHNNNNMNNRSYFVTDQGYSEIGIEQIKYDANNKNSLSGSSAISDKGHGYLEASKSDKDTGYLEVSVAKSDGKLNDTTQTTGPLHTNEMDSGYELVGGTAKPISNIYARLGDSVREFENPYNETLDSDKNLRQSDSENVNVNIGTIPRHVTPDNLKISPGPDDVIVVEEPSDVYAQVMKTKKPDVAISYV